jgi:hypothetical protein
MEDFFGLLFMDICIVKWNYSLIYANFKVTSIIEVGKKCDCEATLMQSATQKSDNPYGDIVKV